MGVATEATEPPHAPRNPSRASATTTRLCPADQHPKPRLSLATCWLPVGTDHPAQPAHPQQPHTARAPAGHRSPTKPTLSTASKDAKHPTNMPHLGPGSLPATPRPAARRRPTPRSPTPASRPGKRRQNPPSRQNQRAATPRTHTGWKQRPVPVTTIPTPCTRSRTVSTKRETVPGT